MSAQKNLQTVQRFYAAVNDGDFPTLLSLVAEDIDWKDAGKALSSAKRQGKPNFEKYAREMSEDREFLEFHPDQFFVSGDTIVVLGHERWRAHGTDHVLEANWAQVFTVSGGLISSFREYTDTTSWQLGDFKRIEQELISVYLENRRWRR